MKRRTFSLFLVLVLILTALAGCGQDNGGSKRSSSKDGDDENEPLLEKGCYEVTDEDEELVGYLEVKKSEIIVYDEDAREEDTLSYEYNEKKGRYELDDGELFGSDRFTVEKSKKKLTLTADDDKYTLEEIDELPGGDIPATKTDIPTGGDGDYIELPTGCYAAYDGRSLQGYMKVTRSSMISYTSSGFKEQELDYSYDRDGVCTLETDYYAYTVTFTKERGDYYMSDEFGSSVRLEQIDEDDIPDFEESADNNAGSFGTGTANDAYYIGGNGPMDLYIWLPEVVYDKLDVDYDDDAMMAMANYSDNDSRMIFAAILGSDDSLQEVIEEAWDSVDGDFGAVDELLYAFARDNIFTGLLESLANMNYKFDEGNVNINSRNWRYCDFYLSEGDTQAYAAMLFWMDGDNLAVVCIMGTAEDYNGSYDDVSDQILNEIISTLRLDT